MFPGASLNYSTNNNVRAGVKGVLFNRKGLTPHGSSVARTARTLEAHGADVHGLVITVSETDVGSCGEIALEPLVRLFLKRTGLEAAATRGSGKKPVLIAVTLDGAKLTNQLGHVTIGFKGCDPRTIDPLTGQFFFADDKVCIYL